MTLAALLIAAVITSLWWRQWCLYEAPLARHSPTHDRPAFGHSGFGAELWHDELTRWPRVRNTQT